MHQNTASASRVIRTAVGLLPTERTCACKTALSTAILTSRDAIPQATREKLEPIVGRVLS